MILTHEKVSGEANTDAGKVGGADWDEPHVLEVGSLFTVNVIGFDWQVSGSVTSHTTICPMVSQFARTGTGQWEATVDTSSYAVRAGSMVVTEIGSVSISGLPAGWTYFCSSNYGTVSINFYNTSGTLANPTNNMTVRILVMGHVE